MSKIEITEAYVLAAVERAARHRPPGHTEKVPMSAIYAHAGVETNSREGRQLHRTMLALEGRELTRAKRLGFVVWALTSAGRARLARLREAGGLPVLPESPQHRDWRLACALAKDHIGELWAELQATVEQASELLQTPTPGPPSPDASSGPSSDVWFEYGDRLHTAARNLAGASYCLWEWREPQDARADIDTEQDPADDAYDPEERRARVARRRARRNPLNWSPNPKPAFLGQAIREAREHQALTPAELASAADLSERQLHNIETGRAWTDYLLLSELAEAMSVQPKAIIARALEHQASERTA